MRTDKGKQTITFERSGVVQCIHAEKRAKDIIALQIKRRYNNVQLKKKKKKDKLGHEKPTSLLLEERRTLSYRR